MSIFSDAAESIETVSSDAVPSCSGMQGSQADQEDVLSIAHK